MLNIPARFGYNAKDPKRVTMLISGGIIVLSCMIIVGIIAFNDSLHSFNDESVAIRHLLSEQAHLDEIEAFIKSHANEPSCNKITLEFVPQDTTVWINADMNRVMTVDQSSTSDYFTGERIATSRMMDKHNTNLKQWFTKYFPASQWQLRRNEFTPGGGTENQRRYWVVYERKNKQPAVVQPTEQQLATAEMKAMVENYINDSDIQYISSASDGVSKIYAEFLNGKGERKAYSSGWVEVDPRYLQEVMASHSATWSVTDEDSVPRVANNGPVMLDRSGVTLTIYKRN